MDYGIGCLFAMFTVCPDGWKAMISRWLLAVSVAVACYGQALFAADGDWQLMPLKYNQPNLKVDLGVGLWAWPMPMDYDQDGDVDLLVACPDKPSNGVYFFENPTQDPSVKLPVFKPGVRLGKAAHNFQVSYVDGRPRILKPGYEFARAARPPPPAVESGNAPAR